MKLVTGRDSGLGARDSGLGIGDSKPRRAPAPASDWRETLRAAGAEPGTAKPAEKSPSQNPESPMPAAGLSVGTPGKELFGGALADLDSLDVIAGRVASCTRCALYRTATNPVPGEG